MPFIQEDFLLTTEAARRLYHEYAADEPILDYHCHLPPKDVAQNRQFGDLFEIWLEGDHYKWRAMRANGVDESLVTGGASPKEKFLAWARTVPATLRNPLYHWTHLELLRYFGIGELLDENTAQAVWAKANELLAGKGLRAWGILDKFRVKGVCTTDDPADDLAWHNQIAQLGLATKVFPTFRPDKALNVSQPAAFNEWIGRLGQASGIDIVNFQSFLDAIDQRHEYFHQMGCRLSDHGLSYCWSAPAAESRAREIFERARALVPATAEEQAEYASFLMLHFGRLDAQKGWTKQLHLMARRNNNTRRFRELGPDTGFDSIGDWPQMDHLAGYLDALDQEGALPKTIVYNLNPSWNYAFATMMGNYQDGRIAGKMQFGSGWWFLDQKEAMEWQMNALSNCGLLSRFVGMLTDSRSFMSYPRHEYFRRVLANLLGKDMENGELPGDFGMVGGMLRRICYENAREYFQLGL
jgi:glucuronate isomerase